MELLEQRARLRHLKTLRRASESRCFHIRTDNNTQQNGTGKSSNERSRQLLDHSEPRECLMPFLKGIQRLDLLIYQYGWITWGKKRDGEESPPYKYLMPLPSMMQSVPPTCCHSDGERAAASEGKASHYAENRTVSMLLPKVLKS